MGAMFVASNVAALALAAPAQSFGYQALPDPQSPANPFIYLAMVLAFTAVILVIVKLKKEAAVKWIILGAMAVTMVYVYSLPLTFLLLALQDPALLNLTALTTAQAELVATLYWTAFGLAVVIAAALTYLLIRFPEWYVVDAVGVSSAAGVTAILGISFGILPALILLAILAGYDAWAVYHTKHMIALADAVTGQRLPVLLVVPKSRDYSFLTQKPLREQIAKGEEREAFFMGLGDIIIPGILAVSAFSFLPFAVGPLGIGRPLLVALGSLCGALAGYAVLMRYVAKGRPQAGLPLLNGGAIGGFALTYLLVYGWPF